MRIQEIWRDSNSDDRFNKQDDILMNQNATLDQVRAEQKAIRDQIKANHTAIDQVNAKQDVTQKQINAIMEGLEELKRIVTDTHSNHS